MSSPPTSRAPHARTTSTPRVRRDARSPRHVHQAPAPRRRLRIAGLLVALAVAALLIVPHLNHAVRDIALPLRNQDIIRQQAALKHLDPALIAAVIYAETRFNPRRSPTGAEGLMQIEPATATFLARLSHGYRFQVSDLATPQVNIAYGSYYLRYLLDHFRGNDVLAVAAYNGGMANVDRWVARAHAQGQSLTVAAIPFPETRSYVQRVLKARGDYRAAYPRQLGRG